MKSQVFISHSTAEADSSLVTAVVAATSEAGLLPFLSETEFSPTPVYEKLRTALLASDYVIAILTPSAVKSPWVNQELAVATELKKPIIPFLEADVKPPGVVSERDQIRFSRPEFSVELKRGIDFILKDKATKDPLFRVMTQVAVDGGERSVTASVLEVVHVHGPGDAHQLSRADVESFTGGTNPCGVDHGPFFARMTYELGAQRHLLWVGIDDLGQAGWKQQDDLYVWPFVIGPALPTEVRSGHAAGPEPVPAPLGVTDTADSGLPRVVLRTTRDVADLEGRKVPSGAEGLFVWFPATTPWGQETVQIRIGETTQTIPLDAVVAVGPVGHAEVWNKLRDRILSIS